MATGIDSTTSLIAPDIAAQQVMLQRRQGIADLLRQQSMTPDQGQMIGQQYIAPSWTQGLARMAQALMASKSQDSIDAQNLELAKQYRGQLAGMIGGSPSDGSVQSSSQGAVSSDGSQTQATGVPTSNAMSMANILRGRAIDALGGAGASGAYWKQFEPTEQTKMAVAAGVDPRQANADALHKNTFIPNTRLTEGAYAGPDNIVHFLPTTAPAGFVNQSDPTNSSGYRTVEVGGGTEAVTASDKAKAMGTAAATPTVAYGPSGTPIFSTKAQDVGRATGNPTVGSVAISNNPNAGSAEIEAMQKSLDTPGAVNDPQSRQMLTDQIAEYKRQAATSYSPAGAVTPQLPPGLSTNADLSQGAQAKTMHDSYAKLQAGNSTAQAVNDAIDKMQVLAARKNAWTTAGVMGTGQTSFNADAAEYEKLRANLIGLIGQRLGSNGTDASNARIDTSVPDFGKPKAAIADELQTLKNQTASQIQLKNNFLTPTYQAGNSQKYTAQESAYDQNIAPSMIPLLTATPGPARAAQLKEAAKDPAMRAKLTWAIENGLLK